MKIVQLASGHRGVRQLAAARAEAALRKLGHLPPIINRGNNGSRPWTDEDFDEACVMRLSGKTHAEIAAKLNRSVDAINRVIGHECAARGSYAVTDK